MTMETQQIGSHLLRIDGDLVRIRWSGEVSPQEVTDLCTCMEAIFERHPDVFVIIDATAAHSMGREARRRGADWPHTHHVRGLAFIGASLTARTVVTIVRAVVKLAGRTPLIPTRFVDTEEQACAWIDVCRREGR